MSHRRSKNLVVAIAATAIAVLVVILARGLLFGTAGHNKEDAEKINAFKLVTGRDY